MTPRSILHLVANRWWTGSAAPALDLAVSLRDRGHHVEFACIPGDVLDARVRAAGFTPPAGLALVRTARPWVVARDVGRLRELVRGRGFDLIHAHQTHDHWLAALAVRGLPTRLVRTVHHRRAAHPGPAARWLFGRTAAVTAPSEAILERLRRGGVPPDRLSLVRGAVDAARFERGATGDAFRVELGLGPAPVVGCVARLVPGRGHDVLLRAAGRLRAAFPELRVVLVGRGEGRPGLEGLVRSLGLAEVVRFAGYRGDDLPEALAALDVFVLLGAGSEESCRAVLEAMAAAKPVVAARVGAVAETVVDGQTGWLARPEPAAVAECLGRLLADPAAARRMGESGRARVRACFSQEGRAEATEAAYARALGERGRLPLPGRP
jgi:glycosyltransferase involved in cell wall biosynthesis